MIRINLIEGSQKRARSPRVAPDAFSTPSTPPAVKLGVGFAILAVAGVFGHYTLLQREASSLQADLEKEQREAQRLSNVQQEFNENNARKQTLIHRISIIDDLKNNQSGPSSLMATMADTVVNARAVWLTSMKQKGTEIALDGSALNMDAVANLMSQMLVSGYFQSVDLNETLEQPNGQLVRTAFNFKLAAQVGAAPVQMHPAAQPQSAGNSAPVQLQSAHNSAPAPAPATAKHPAAPQPASGKAPAPKPRVPAKS